MTPKRRRLWIVLACGVGLSGATALGLVAFKSNLVFFEAPSQLIAHAARPGQVIRLGGLVEQGSLRQVADAGRPVARFRITDGNASVEVSYVGILPDLFREGQGIVAIGEVRPDGVFGATEVLAKHDETYMPRDVAEALEKSGRWRPSAGPPPPPSTWDMLMPKAKAHE
jgi:cytochrome c-type biogenesis protein CcmE